MSVSICKVTVFLIFDIYQFILAQRLRAAASPIETERHSLAMDTIAKAVLNRLLARFIKGFNLDVSLRSGSAEVRDVEGDVAALDKALLGGAGVEATRFGRRRESRRCGRSPPSRASRASCEKEGSAEDRRRLRRGARRTFEQFVK